MSNEVRLPRHTAAQIKGNLAEAFLEYRMESYANVHRIEQSKDWGIDFYCELRLDDHPYLPFFVQCKGTEEYSRGEDVYTRTEKAATVNYWLRQKFPVFVVAVDLQEKEGNYIASSAYWYSVTEAIPQLQKKIKEGVENISISVPRDNEIADAEKFQRQIILDYIRLCLREGYVPPIPQLKETYVQSRLYELQFLATYERRIKDTCRESIHALGMLWMENRPEIAIAYFQEAIEIDKLYPEAQHYQHYEWLGKTYLETGDEKRGLEALKRAVQIIEEDPNVEGHPYFMEKKDELKKIIRGIEIRERDRKQ